jgi:broad specificity phosphatase PhoE
MTTVLLVRHAQAALPDDLRLPGPDLPLTPRGEEEAGLLASRLGDFDPALILSSDARRALQTAEVVARENGLPLQVTSALREMNFGDWAGRTYAEIASADPAAADWFTHPADAAPPNGEPVADAASRVLSTLRESAEHRTGHVVVIGHSGSLRLAVAAALGMPLASWWRLRLDCASISVVTSSADGLILERWNDAAHLDRA